METIENTATITGEAKSKVLKYFVAGNPAGLVRSERFTPADVLRAFGAEFLDDEYCRRWILKKLYPAGVHCPQCGKDVSLPSFWKGHRVRCGFCGKYFTALTGTFLSGCHLNFREIVLLSVLLALDLADKHIAQILHMSAENVRLWRLKFKTIKDGHAD